MPQKGLCSWRPLTYKGHAVVLSRNCQPVLILYEGFANVPKLTGFHFGCILHFLENQGGHVPARFFCKRRALLPRRFRVGTLPKIVGLSKLSCRLNLSTRFCMSEEFRYPRPTLLKHLRHTLANSRRDEEGPCLYRYEARHLLLFLEYEGFRK